MSNEKKEWGEVRGWGSERAREREEKDSKTCHRRNLKQKEEEFVGWEKTKTRDIDIAVDKNNHCGNSLQF